MSEELIYPVNNKIRKIVLILFSLVLIEAFVMLFFGKSLSSFFDTDIYTFYFLAICVLFFSIAIILIMFYRLKNSDKNYFKISEIGIDDKSNAFAYGLIKWSEIKDLKFTTINSVNYVAVFLNEPEKYIENSTRNALLKKAMRLNLKEIGTPIIISAQFIKGDLEEFRNVLLSNFQKYK